MQNEINATAQAVSSYEENGYLKLSEMLISFSKELGEVVESDRTAQIADAVDLLKGLQNEKIALAVVRCANADEPANEWVDFVFEQDLPASKQSEYAGKGLMIAGFSKYLNNKSRLEELVAACPSCTIPQD
jgi:hypothetical protein